MSAIEAVRFAEEFPFDHPWDHGSPPPAFAQKRASARTQQVGSGHVMVDQLRALQRQDAEPRNSERQGRTPRRSLATREDSPRKTVVASLRRLMIHGS
jgi:hypothetical protein